MSEDDSEPATSISETESKALTVESGTATLEERTLSSKQEQGAFPSSLSDSTQTHQTLFRLLKKKKMLTSEFGV